MEAIASLRYLRITPRKVRVVADLVRGKPVEEALGILRYVEKRAGATLEKLVRSAVANAEKAGEVDVDRLWVETLTVDQGPMMKRFMPRALGRAFKIQKKTSHVKLVLTDAPRKKKHS
jgi:large subunit ribosomal protein L22